MTGLLLVLHLLASVALAAYGLHPPVTSSN